jgi:hypothetical protein
MIGKIQILCKLPAHVDASTVDVAIDGALALGIGNGSFTVAIGRRGIAAWVTSDGRRFFATTLVVVDAITVTTVEFTIDERIASGRLRVMMEGEHRPATSPYR